MTWDIEPPWGSFRTPASPYCCRSPSTSLARATALFMLCGGHYETWGRMGRELCTTCCDRLQWTTLMHESISPQRSGWTTVTWSSRKRQEKTGESDYGLLNLLVAAVPHSTTDLHLFFLTNLLSSLTFIVLLSVIKLTLLMLRVCSVLVFPFMRHYRSEWVSFPSYEALSCTRGHSQMKWKAFMRSLWSMQFMGYRHHPHACLVKIWLIY